MSERQAIINSMLRIMDAIKRSTDIADKDKQTVTDMAVIAGNVAIDLNRIADALETLAASQSGSAGKTPFIIPR